MTNRAKRILLTILMTILVLIIGIVSFQVPLEKGLSILIAGIIILGLSYIFSRISPYLDWNERYFYSSDDFEPNLWSFNGILFGTRLIKGKSNPYVAYTFLYFMFVPFLPIRCHASTIEPDPFNPGELRAAWCGAKWNIMDVATIYYRWFGFILIFIALVKIFS